MVTWLYKGELHYFVGTRPSFSVLYSHQGPLVLRLRHCSTVFSLLLWFVLSYFDTLGGKTLGDAEEPSSHELRQTESLFALLLWEGNYAKGIVVASSYFMVSYAVFFPTSTLTLSWEWLYILGPRDSKYRVQNDLHKMQNSNILKLAFKDSNVPTLSEMLISLNKVMLFLFDTSVNAVYNSSTILQN